MSRGTELPGVNPDSLEAFIKTTSEKITPLQLQTISLLAAGKISAKDADELFVVGLNDKDKDAVLDVFGVIDLYFNGVLSDQEFEEKFDEVVSRYREE